MTFSNIPQQCSNKIQTGCFSIRFRVKSAAITFNINRSSNNLTVFSNIPFISSNNTPQSSNKTPPGPQQKKACRKLPSSTPSFYTLSIIKAIPCPPPIQRLATAYFPLRRCSSYAADKIILVPLAPTG